MSAITQQPTYPLFDHPDDQFAEHVREHGFAILRDALSPTEVARVNGDAIRLCRGDYGAIGSADGDLVLDNTLSDDEVLRSFLCIHFPHKASPAARQAMTAPRVVTALTRVIGPNVKCMQSMLFIKAEGRPGQAWHQDEHFIPTRDRSLTAAWIALDDATVDNGCLWVLPGSHRRGVLYPERVQNDPRFDCTGEAHDFPHRDEDAVPVEVPAGAAVIFNGYLLHRSLPNNGSRGYRRALVNHYMSAESLLPWHRSDEPFAVADHRDIVMVAGEDPYAYKGITDVARPGSRPDKEGGCDR